LNRPVERVWSALLLRVPAPLSDELLALLSDRSLGAWSVGSEANGSELRLYFGTQEEAESARQQAARFLERAGTDPARCDLTIQPVPDEHWVERYQAGLRPFHFATRFVVCPSGETPPAGERIPIRLVPGRAFGTGEHPTTRLCAEFLERRMRPGQCWVDLGCGSGILSLVALACGAGEVLAVDTDPDALEVAREVFDANDATGKILLRGGSTKDLPGEQDGIVANILDPFFHEQASALAGRLRPGGTLVASGFDSAQVDEVEQALSSAGFRVDERRGMEDWRALACVRPDDGNA
jgi:ribosomal protein L11 methyltransferase